MKQFRLPAPTDRASLDYFPLMHLVILDGVQICYLYGQQCQATVLGVMVAGRVVYTEHISDHLGNNLSTEVLGLTHGLLDGPEEACVSSLLCWVFLGRICKIQIALYK